MAATKQKTYYDILGVSEEASQDEIRKAYLKLAHKYHPDKTGGDTQAETKLKEINEAYHTLKNAEKRKEYDQARKAGFGGGAGGFQGFSGAEGFDFGGAGSPFEDLFSSMFGGGAARGATARGPRPGNDLEARLTVSLREAATGTRKTLRVNRRDTCSDCHGTGAKPGTSPQTCPDCKGSGHTVVQQGFFSARSTCRTCGGTGTIIKDPCGRCAGSGVVRGERDITVDIPAGVDTGMRLRLAGQGEAGPHGGPNGDLYVYVQVAADELFTREGADLILDVPVTMTDAALGATIRVPTLTGAADLTIPEGTQTGRQFRMRGLGMPRLKGAGKGDQIVRIQVEVPARLNARQKELLREFSGDVGPEHYHKKEGFLDKLKRLGGF
jgi:molecular chaperone DnaJ